MKLVSLVSLLAVGAVSGSFVSQALAAEPDFRLSVTGARASMVTKKEKSGDAKEVETKGSTLLTMPDKSSIEFAVNWEGNGIYINPITDSGFHIAYGKSLSDTMEVGVQLGLNGMKLKVGDADEEKESSYRLGLTYWGSLPMGENAIEVNVNPFFIFGGGEKTETTKAEGTTPASSIKVETNSSMMGASADIGYVIPLKKNFDYVVGADLTFTSGETKAKPKDGTEAKSKMSAFDLGLVLARFRARF